MSDSRMAPVSQASQGRDAAAWKWPSRGLDSLSLALVQTALSFRPDLGTSLFSRAASTGRRRPASRACCSVMPGRMRLSRTHGCMAAVLMLVSSVHQVTLLLVAARKWPQAAPILERGVYTWLRMSPNCSSGFWRVHSSPKKRPTSPCMHPPLHYFSIPCSGCPYMVRQSNRP
jgi:hypothetical protein